MTDREVRAYYDAHEDEFDRSATGRFNLAVISKTPTAADTLAAFRPQADDMLQIRHVRLLRTVDGSA